MLLKDITKKVRIMGSKGDLNVCISGLSQNVAKAKKGDLFFCYKGVNFDGHNFCDDLLKKEVSALVVERYLNIDLPQILVKKTRKVMPKICNIFFNDVLNDLFLIGVTGTNGKTTTTSLIFDILKTNNYQVGLIGTNGIKFAGNEVQSNLTTPDTIDLFYILNDMKLSGIKLVIMEVSAHALALDKLLGLKFEIGVFTNLTQDHLDFFKTMEKYSLTKLKFLNKKYCKNCFINIDDNKGNLFAKISNSNVFTYGIENPANCFAMDLKLSSTKTNFIANVFDNVFIVNSPLTCRFNVYNLLVSIMVTKFIGLTDEQILFGISKLSKVDGRMNTYKLFTGAVAIIDFAHTPDGLEKVLKSLKQINKDKKIVTIFGCGGNRDFLKRPIMGKIACSLSDYVFITSDNPRSENTNDIVKDITTQLKCTNYEIIVDRKLAIKKAIETFNDNSIILIAGKGAEKYQEINGVKIEYSDEEEIKKYIL